MSDGTAFLRVAADKIGAPGSPARMPFRVDNAANRSSIVRVGAKMAVIRRRIEGRAVSSRIRRAGRVAYGEFQLMCGRTGWRKRGPDPGLEPGLTSRQ